MAGLCATGSEVCAGVPVMQKCDEIWEAEARVSAHADGGQMRVKQDGEGNHE